MTVDRSYIRVKALVILLSADGTRHIVSRNDPTAENPNGYDRLIGGSIELGELSVEAAAREVKEELLVDVDDLRPLNVVENIFQINGEPGHEVVFVYAGSVPESTVPPEGATFHEADGSEMPVVWRPVDASTLPQPLYPTGAQALVDALVSGQPARHA